MRAVAMPSFTVERSVGRLIEARIWALDDVDAANAYAAALGRAASELTGDKAGILCADHRFAAIYPQPVTDRLLELFRVMNSRLQRVAIVVPARQATFYMQLSRIVRAADNDARKVFKAPDAAASWLAPLLTDAELTRAQTFLADTPD